MLTFFLSNLLKLNIFFYIPISIVFVAICLLCTYLYYSQVNNLDQRNVVLALVVVGGISLYALVIYSINSCFLLPVDLLNLYLSVSNTYHNFLFSVN